MPGLARAQSGIDALYQAAKSEGELTWYIVPFASATAERMGAAFTEAFPGVKVNVVRTTATVAFPRLNQDKIRRASCGDRAGQYVMIPVDAVVLKKKTKITPTK